MVQATQSDISTLCGQNLLLWMQYLELVTFNKIITHHLAREHHLQRVGYSDIVMSCIRHRHRQHCPQTQHLHSSQCGLQTQTTLSTDSALTFIPV